MRAAATTVLLLAALFCRSARAAEPADPFDGKSLEEIKRLIQARMEDRKKDSEFLAEYQTFVDREEKKISRRGLSLANTARAKIGEYTWAEYLFRFGQHSKSREVLLAYEKKSSKNRRGANWALFVVYRLMAANYAWVGRAGDATIALGQSRQSGDVGNTINSIQKIVQEFPAMKSQLDELKRRRDFNPRSGDLQWTLCEFYASKIFLPLEESLELAWTLKSFPDHPKVKAGDADWAMIGAQEKLADWASALALCLSFRKEFPNHFACRQGDLTWSLAKAMFGVGKYKDAKKTAEQMKIEFPKNKYVESRTVNTFIAECENAMNPKTPLPDTGLQWNQWWEY